MGSHTYAQIGRVPALLSQERERHGVGWVVKGVYHSCTITLNERPLFGSQTTCMGRIGVRLQWIGYAGALALGLFLDPNGRPRFFGGANEPDAAVGAVASPSCALGLFFEPTVRPRFLGGGALPSLLVDEVVETAVALPVLDVKRGAALRMRRDGARWTGGAVRT